MARIVRNGSLKALAVFGLLSLSGAGVAQAQPFEIRATTESPPGTMELWQNCDAANRHAQITMQAPPICGGGPFNRVISAVFPADCAVNFVAGAPDPAAEYMQNLGQGWRHWMLGSFSFAGEKCARLRGFVRVAGVTFDSGWHDLGPLLVNRLYVSFARPADGSQYAARLDRERESCTPLNRRLALVVPDLSVSMQFHACREGEGSPLNGCKPKTPSAGLPGVGNGHVPDAAELAAFKPPSPLPTARLSSLDQNIGCAKEEKAGGSGSPADSALAGDLMANLDRLSGQAEAARPKPAPQQAEATKPRPATTTVAAADVGNDACQRAVDAGNRAALEAMKRPGSNDCSVRRQRFEEQKQFTDRVIAACGANSRDGKIWREAWEVAESTERSVRRTLRCPP